MSLTDQDKKNIRQLHEIFSQMKFSIALSPATNDDEDKLVAAQMLLVWEALEEANSLINKEKS